MMDIVALRERLTRIMPAFVGDECWPWPLGHMGLGYGNLAVDGEMITAHVASYIAFRGNHRKGVDVRHLCNDKSCWRPDHLENDGRSKNMLQAFEDGLAPRGSERHYSKLTEDDVRRIRSLRDANYHVTYIAEIIGKPLTSVRNVYYNQAWKWVE